MRAAHDYWLSKRQGRLMPSRADIDPVEIPTLLPYVMLIDVVEPLDFRYRLIGTEARSIMRRNYTGLFFSEIEGKDESSILWQGCEAVVRGKQPLSLSPPYIGTETLKKCENVLLPLSDNRVDVTMILKVVSFERG